MIPLPLMISRWLPGNRQWRHSWQPSAEAQLTASLEYWRNRGDREMVREDILALRVLRALKGGRR